MEGTPKRPPDKREMLSGAKNQKQSHGRTLFTRISAASSSPSAETTVNEKVVVRSDLASRGRHAICGSRKGKQTHLRPRGAKDVGAARNATRWRSFGDHCDRAHSAAVGRWHVGCWYRAFEHFIGRRFPYLESLPCATRSRSTTAFAACPFTAFARLIVLSWRSRSFLTLAACGDDGRPAHSDGGPVDAGAERREAGPPIMIQPVSNTPNAVFRQTVIDAPDLLLLSSNLVQAPSNGRPGEYFRNWHGEIVNNGSKPACLVQVNIGFQSSGGEALVSFEAFAEGEAHEIEPHPHLSGALLRANPQGHTRPGMGRRSSRSIVSLRSTCPSTDSSAKSREARSYRSSFPPQSSARPSIPRCGGSQARPRRWATSGTPPSSRTASIRAGSSSTARRLSTSRVGPRGRIGISRRARGGLRPLSNDSSFTPSSSLVCRARRVPHAARRISRPTPRRTRPSNPLPHCATVAKWDVSPRCAISVPTPLAAQRSSGRRGVAAALASFGPFNPSVAD